MKQRFFLLGVIALLGLLLAACGSATPVVIVVTATPDSATPAAETGDDEPGASDEPAAGATVEEATEPDSTPAVASSEEDEAPGEQEGGADAPAGPTPAADGEKPAAGDGRIAFMGPYGQEMQSFLINADGSGLTIIDEGAGRTLFPSLSPDGEKVAFVSERDGDPDIYVKDLTTQEITRLTDTPGTDFLPVFSPDGERIAFVSERSGQSDIWIMDADGQNAEALTTREETDLLGSWSPDGESLVIVGAISDTQTLWSLDVASGELAQLTEEGSIDNSPVFSPDGERIAFFSNRGGSTFDIHTIAADGGDLQRLTNGPEDNVFPVYSPDGEWIAYTSVQQQSLVLAAIPAEGGAPVTLNADLQGYPMSWSGAAAPLEETGLTQAPPAEAVEVSEEVLASSPSRGDPNAPVTIVEFSDYQCPFCKRFFDSTLVELEPYIENGQVRFVWVDFPLDIHPQAPAAAEAARCAGAQGGEDAYWQMHDVLFSTQEQWSGQDEPAPIFGTLADEAGLDGDQIVACIESGEYRDEVQAGLREGERLQVSGTPTFFVNGTRIVGAQPFDAFRPMLEEVGAIEGPAQEGVEISEAILAGAPSKGDPDAPVTVVEFSDYQCPFCKQFFDTSLPELEPYIESGQVRFVWIDFPLDNHPQAPAAARAAWCAQEQGDMDAYWQMHDALFGAQDQWAGQEQPFPIFGDLADEAGLDGDQLVACLESGRYRDEVQAGFEEGVRLQVSATPTFFINGARLVGAQPFDAFRPLIEAGLP